MILKRLRLGNFRRFRELEIDFHDRLTVIVARNGQGKTSVLDAAAMALGPFVGAFDLGRDVSILPSDACYRRNADSPDGEPQYPVRIEAAFDRPAIATRRELTGPKSRATVKDAAEMVEYGRRLQAMVREIKAEPLPVVAYYGAGRLWKPHRDPHARKVLTESRTLGYEDCLSSASNFLQIQQWMAKATLAELQRSKLPELYPDADLGDRIAAIQGAINAVLAEEGWSGFHYSIRYEESAMFHPDHGILPVRLLSDGIRAMVSLAADLAFRCVRLNGFWGKRAPRLSGGLALIDEVDMHLHPAWQQRVIHSLQQAFPLLQFIVTTHSPQVLSTVDSESIRVLSVETDADGGEARTVVVPVTQQTKGVASSDVLATVMAIDPVPDEDEARQLSEYRALIEQGLDEEEEGVALRRRLLDHFGARHPVMLDCERLIRLQAIKRRLPARG